MEGCAHFCQFVDVVFSEEYQYEQRWQCVHCGDFLFIQLTPFGPGNSRMVTREG